MNAARLFALVPYLLAACGVPPATLAALVLFAFEKPTPCNGGRP